MLMHRGKFVGVAVMAIAVLMTGCATQEPVPLPVTPAGEASRAPVVRRTIPEPETPPVVASIPPGESRAPVPVPAIIVPPEAIYVCVSNNGGEQKQTAIMFVPKVEKLCRRHPEMGPCQYERDICRRSGGRVFAAGGTEITLATEAEYDKKVLRVRFKAN
jgi:hypothetical protein